MSVTTTAKVFGRTAGITLSTLADSLRGRLSTDTCDARLRGWGKALLADAKATVTVDGPGLEAAESPTPLVVMSNHQSHYDIPTLFSTLPGSMRMVAKAELFRIPLWGRAMLEAGFIRIHRSDRQKAIASLDEAAEQLRRGTRIWIAPEGTRSVDGSLGPFKKGGFHLAIGTKTPILPVAISGTRDILRAHAKVIRHGARIHVHVGNPITPDLPLDALVERVRAAITEGYERAQAVSAGAGESSARRDRSV